VGHEKKIGFFDKVQYMSSINSSKILSIHVGAYAHIQAKAKEV
jgi:hypothetical protein